VKQGGSRIAWPCSTAESCRRFGRPDELAAELWDGLEAEVDLGAPIDERTLAAVASIEGVMHATELPHGLHLRVHDRDALAVVVATLVAREVPVYSAVPRVPTLEDVYFAIEERFS